MGKKLFSKSILPITAKSESDRPNRFLGTGFVIYAQGASRFLLTCAHVITGLSPSEIGCVSNLPFEEVVVSEDFDLAVICVKDLHYSPLPVGSKAKVNENVELIGWTSSYRNGPIKRSTTLRVTSETIHAEPSGFTTLDLEIIGRNRLMPGYSGSPILNDKDVVVAVANGRTHNGSIGQAIPIHHLTQVWLDAPDDLLVGTYSTETDNIPFANRKIEKDKLVYFKNHNRDLTQYFCIDGPEGCGKSTLVQQVEEEYLERGNWISSHVRVDKTSTIEDIAESFLYYLKYGNNGLEIPSDLLLKTRNCHEAAKASNLGSLIGQFLVKKFTDIRGHERLANDNSLYKIEGILIAFDFEGPICEKLLEEIIIGFIPKIYQRVKRLSTHVRRETPVFSIIICGTGVSNEINDIHAFEQGEPYEKILLSPFKYDDILESATNYYTRFGYSLEVITRATLMAMTLGGSHPGCMAHVFRHYNYQCDEDQCKHSFEIWQDYISRYANAATNMMQAIVYDEIQSYLVCLLRFVDDAICDLILAEYPSDQFSEGQGHLLRDTLSDSITSTSYHNGFRPLFLTGGSIVRKLVTLNLCISDPIRFIELSRKTQEFCKYNLQRWIYEPADDLIPWFLEYIYQVLQEYMGRDLIIKYNPQTLAIPNNRAEWSELFFNRQLPEIISVLKSVYSEKGFTKRQVRRKNEELMSLIRGEASSELLELANYSFRLRDTEYNTSPSRRLVDTLEDRLNAI